MNLRAEILQPEQNTLLPLLRASYGQNYVGDINTSRHFDRVSKVIGLRDALGSLVAAALIEGVSHNRIINVATLSDGPTRTTRSDVMVRLLEECYSEGTASWISIGEEYTKMQNITQRAGMARLSPAAIVANLLSEAGLFHHYAIEHDVSHNPIIITLDGHNQGYVQQVWAWNDRFPLDSNAVS